MIRRRRCGLRARGVSLVEFAIILPILIFTFGAGADYARIFYYASVVSGCARNGAVYASRSQYDPVSPYTSLTQAALSDAADLSPAPTVSSANGVDANGNPYVDVTVSYEFRTVATWGVVPASTNVTRTVRMVIAPDSPK